MSETALWMRAEIDRLSSVRSYSERVQQGFAPQNTSTSVGSCRHRLLPIPRLVRVAARRLLAKTENDFFAASLNDRCSALGGRFSRRDKGGGSHWHCYHFSVTTWAVMTAVTFKHECRARYGKKHTSRCNQHNSQATLVLCRQFHFLL